MVEFAASDGVHLHLEIEGVAIDSAAIEGAESAPAVVLVHGFAGTLDLAWRAVPVIDRLVARGLRVVAYDLRGHGRSGAPHGRARYGDQRMVDDLFEIVRDFGGTRPVVVGYSMGAAITLLALERGLPVGGAVVGAAAPAVLEWTPANEALAASVVDALEGRAEPDAEIAGFLAFLDASGADKLALAGVLAGHRPVVERWGAITARPIVVLAGRDDTMAAQPEAVAARLRGATTVIVPGDHYTAPASQEFVTAIVDVVVACTP